MTEISRRNNKFKYIQQNYLKIKAKLIKSLKTEKISNFEGQVYSDSLVEIFVSDLINILMNQVLFIRTIYLNKNKDPLSNLFIKNNEKFTSSIIIFYKKIVHLMNPNNKNKQNNILIKRQENTGANNSENSKKKNSPYVYKYIYPKKSIINLSELFNDKDPKIMDIQISPQKNKEIRKLHHLISDNEKDASKKRKLNLRKISNSNDIQLDKNIFTLTSLGTEGNNKIIKISLDSSFNPNIKNNLKRNSKKKSNYLRKPLKLIRFPDNNTLNNFLNLNMKNKGSKNNKANKKINFLRLSPQSSSKMADIKTNTIKVNFDQNFQDINYKTSFNSFNSYKYFKKKNNKNNKNKQQKNLSEINEYTDNDSNLYIRLLNNNKTKNKKMI